MNVSMVPNARFSGILPMLLRCSLSLVSAVSNMLWVLVTLASAVVRAMEHEGVAFA